MLPKSRDTACRRSRYLIGRSAIAPKELRLIKMLNGAEEAARNAIATCLILPGAIVVAQTCDPTASNAPMLLSSRFFHSIWFSLLCVAALAGLLVVLFHRLRRTLAMRPVAQARIGSDIHDALLQDMQGLIFSLQAVRQMLPERPNEAVALLDTALDNGDLAVARGHDAGLYFRDSLLAQGEITDTLIALGAELSAASRNSMPKYQVLTEGQSRSIDPVVWEQAYEITRTVFRNALIYAHAAKIEVELSFGRTHFAIHVRDDGVGMDLSEHQLRPGKERAGFVALYDYAAQFGGELSVWSQIGAGTEFELRIPQRIAYRARRNNLSLPTRASPR